MGIFYNPPPPAGRTAVTPPEPHVPIGTQGSQPPRYTTVLMLAVVLASWPQDLEPRLQRPNEQRVKIAPLTFTYGQQPPRFSVASQMAVVGLAWPPDLEPRLGRPNADRIKIAPLTFTYGAQPPPIAPLSVAELTQIVATWPVTWDAQTAPKNASWNVPLIVAFVPRTAAPTLLWTAWEPPFIRPQTLVSIAPLTLPSGTQPQPQPPLATTELAQIVASWPLDVGPTLPWTEPPSVIGTFATVTQPQPQSPLSVVELAQIVGTWAQTWDAQTAAPNAPWNVPVVPPPVAALRLILVNGRLAIHLGGMMYDWL